MENTAAAPRHASLATENLPPSLPVANVAPSGASLFPVRERVRMKRGGGAGGKTGDSVSKDRGSPEGHIRRLSTEMYRSLTLLDPQVEAENKGAGEHDRLRSFSAADWDYIKDMMAEKHAVSDGPSSGTSSVDGDDRMKRAEEMGGKLSGGPPVLALSIAQEGIDGVVACEVDYSPKPR